MKGSAALARWSRLLLKRARSPYDALRTGVYLVSFPKCGRTWLRVLIGKALCEAYHLPEALLLDTYTLTKRAGLLRTRVTHDDASIKEGRPYQRLSWGKRRYRGKKVVFLVRDVRDVLVSCYFQATRRVKCFEGSISDFIRSDAYGARKVVTFYNIWHTNRHIPQDFLLVRYEEMRADPRKVLWEVLRFLGAQRMEDGVLDRAVAYASFDNMKELERQRSFESRMVQPGDAGDAESFKVRRGAVGGYREYLSPDDIRYVDDVVRELGCPFDERVTEEKGERP